MHTPQTSNSAGDTPAEEFPPTPDEDGPHDVPDDQVIEKTLPTVPVGGIGEASA